MPSLYAADEVYYCTNVTNDCDVCFSIKKYIVIANLFVCFTVFFKDVFDK